MIIIIIITNNDNDDDDDNYHNNNDAKTKNNKNNKNYDHNKSNCRFAVEILRQVTKKKEQTAGDKKKRNKLTGLGLVALSWPSLWPM